MSQILFEQYKEALRRGHIAVGRGHLEAAVSAYEAAAAVAPDRALPHTSLGEVLNRLGRHDASERAYDAALRRAPADEAALRGRAAVYLELRRPLDAARDLEALADALERAGRLADACNAACAALDIAESRARRRRVERFADQLAELVGDAAASEAAARTARYLEPAAAVRADSDETEAEGMAEEAEAAAMTAPPIAFDPVAARMQAEAVMASGETSSARPLLLSIAAAERKMGRLDAALDACLILMTIDPADPAVQLEIAANQAARGWTELVRDKVMLLGRLADLDSNGPAAAMIRGFAQEYEIAGLAADPARGSVAGG